MNIQTYELSYFCTMPSENWMMQQLSACSFMEASGEANEICGTKGPGTALIEHA